MNTSWQLFCIFISISVALISCMQTELEPVDDVNDSVDKSAFENLMNEAGDNSEKLVTLSSESGQPQCWTVAPADNGLALIQLDMITGEWVEVGRYPSADEPIPDSFHTYGMGLFDGSLIMAGYMGNEFQWVELDLKDGLVRVAGPTEYANSASSHKNKIITPCEDSSSVCYFDDFKSLTSDNPSEVVDVGDCELNSLAVSDDILYCAWHSLSEIDRFSLQLKKNLRAVGVENWDGWVYGISVVGKRIYLLGDDRENGWPSRFGTFDAETGELIDEFFINFRKDFSRNPTGLWCG